MTRTFDYPRLYKSLTAAIGNVLDSLPSDVRRQLRSNWKWRIGWITDPENRLVAYTTRNGLITFHPEFVERLVDAGEQSALEALCAHELAHVYRHVRRETGDDISAEERAANSLMRDWGFSRDLRNLKSLSGYSIGSI